MGTSVQPELEDPLEAYRAQKLERVDPLLEYRRTKSAHPDTGDIDLGASQNREQTRESNSKPLPGAVDLGLQYVGSEIRRGGAALADQVRQIKEDARLHGAAKAALHVGESVAHGFIDPLITLGKELPSTEDEMAGTPDSERKTGLPAYHRETERLAEQARANARNNQPGDTQDEAGEEAAAEVRRARRTAAIAAPIQTAANIAAPGVFSAVEKVVAPAATRVAGEVAGKVISGLAGEAAAGATANAPSDLEHPLAGAVTGAGAGIALGEAGRLTGRAVGAGARGAEAVGRQAGEAADVVRSFLPKSRVRALQEELSASEERRAVAERDANHDALTGAANVRAYRNALPAAEADPNSAVVRFDLNGFKALNDTHGHSAGDETLVQVPTALTQAANELAIPERVFRVGGDEFAAIVPKESADAFRGRAEELYGVRDHGEGVRTSLSGGIGATDALADRSLYDRKSEQRTSQAIAPRSTGRERVASPDVGSAQREMEPTSQALPARDELEPALVPEDKAFERAESTDLRGPTRQNEPPDPLAAYREERTSSQADGRNERLRQALQLETDPARRAAAATEIAARERSLNPGQVADDAEMRARSIAAEARGGVPTPGPDRELLFSPAAQPSPLGVRMRRALGIKSSNTGDVVALRRISLNLAEAAGVPMLEGRGNLKRMKAAGAFWQKPEVIRVRRLKALDVASHEGGHYFDKKYDILGNTKLLPKADRLPVMAELIKMGRDLYGSRNPAGGYAREGIAQWFRFLVTDRARMIADAPNFTRYMNTLLDREPALRDMLNKAHDDWQTYQAAPANAKLASMIEQGLPHRLDGLSPARLIDHWFNDLQPIRRAVDALHSPGSMSEDAAILAELTKGNAGRARDILDNGVIDFASRKRLSRGLSQILQAIGEKDRDAFTQYIVAEQVLTKTAQGIDTGFDVEAAKDVAAEGRQNPKFVAAAKEVWDFRSGLLNYMAGAGLMTPQEVAAIRGKNPTPTPFYRAFETEEGGSGRSPALAKNSSGVFRMKGSDRPILDPLQSIVHDTYTMVDRAQKHYAATVLVKAALETEGGGHIAQLLPEVPKELRRVGIDRVREQLVDAGWTPPADPDLAAALGNGVLEAFYEKSRAGARELRDQVLPILLDGERKWVQITDQATWEALEGMSVPGLGVYERILTAPTRTLRLGATQANPDFALLNPLRDAFSAAIYTAGPSHLPGYHLARGVFHLLKSHLGTPDELTARWAQEGAENAGMIGADKRTMTKEYIRTLHEMMRDRQTAFLDHLKHPVRTMREAFELFENGTRLGEFSEVRSERMNAGKSEIESSVEAAYSSRNVTQDFFKAGRTARIVNRYIPFFAAQLGDIYKLAQEFNPANFTDPATRARAASVYMRAAAYLTVPSIALYLLQKDDEDYQEIPEYYKANAWVIVDKKNGPIPFTLRSGKQVRIWAIPRPYLLGFVFGYAPEKILAWATEQDPEAIDQLAKNAWSAFAPSFIPTIAGPFIENYANRSTYSGKPIVPRQMEGLEPSEQSQPHTGETARVVGKITNSSPAQIENVVRGYTGGAGMTALHGLDWLLEHGERAVGKKPLSPAVESSNGDPLDHAPVIGRFILSQPAADAKSVQRVFDDFAAAERKRQTWRALMKAGQMERAAALLKDYRAEIQSVASKEDTGSSDGELRQIHQALTELTKTRRQLSAAQIPPAAKLEKLQQIGLLERSIARNYYQRVKAQTR